MLHTREYCLHIHPSQIWKIFKKCLRSSRWFFFLQIWSLTEKYRHFGQIYLHIWWSYLVISLYIVTSLLYEWGGHTNNVEIPSSPKTGYKCDSKPKTNGHSANVGLWLMNITLVHIPARFKGDLFNISALTAKISFEQRGMLHEDLSLIWAKAKVSEHCSYMYTLY